MSLQNVDEQPAFRPKVVIVLRRGEVTYASSNGNGNVDVIVHNADAHGHEAGDALLDQVAKGCIECDVRTSDQLGTESEI